MPSYDRHAFYKLNNYKLKEIIDIFRRLYETLLNAQLNDSFEQCVNARVFQVLGETKSHDDEILSRKDADELTVVPGPCANECAERRRE